MVTLRAVPIALLAIAIALFAPHAALAHISLEQAGTHVSRNGDANIKDAPCGLLDDARGDNVYTYEPGETITIRLIETIPHPGYFRIAFDDDGTDDFVDPVSIKPVDPNRECPFNEFDQCGTTDDAQDLYNTPAVLPNMDYLDPHVTSSFGAEWSWEVTLPEVECDNCTLQIIQVMEDTIHGGYNTDRSIEPGYIEDVYHTCIDIELKRSESSPGAGGTMGAAARPKKIRGLPRAVPGQAEAWRLPRRRAMAEAAVAWGDRPHSRASGRSRLEWASGSGAGAGRV